MPIGSYSLFRGADFEAGCPCFLPLSSKAFRPSVGVQVLPRLSTCIQRLTGRFRGASVFPSLRSDSFHSNLAPFPAVLAMASADIP